MVCLGESFNIKGLVMKRVNVVLELGMVSYMVLVRKLLCCFML